VPLYDMELAKGLDCGNRLGGVVGPPGYMSCGACGDTDGIGTHCGG
jgi:hypothetical protein